MKDYEYQRNYELEQRYWWFVGVREIIRGLVKGAAGGRRLGRVLDVGCGTGAWLDEMRGQCDELWGADISEQALAFCRQRGHDKLLQGDATNLPFESGSFALITAIGVIEHLDDDAAFLREMHRLLEPGGSLVLLTSSMPFLWSEHDVANEHRRRYYLRDLRRLSEQAGFSVKRLSHMNFILFPALSAALLAHRALFGLRQARPERLLPQVPGPINAALASVLKMEAKLISRFTLPWGISMVGTLEKAA